MSGVRRFEDLDCHKLAVLVRREVIRLTARAPVAGDARFVSQIRDSARGAPRNIAEGYSRFNPPEIRRFLTFAKASLDETKNHMVDGKESGYFSDEETQQVLTLIARTKGAIRNWRAYLESPAARRFYAQNRARLLRAAHSDTPEPREPPDPPEPPEPREP